MIYNDLQHGAIALNLFFSSAFPVISLFLFFFAAHVRDRRRQFLTRQSTPDSINKDVPFILFTR